MPKIKEPSIRLMLRKSKKNVDGMCPIYLRVSFGGMVETATGYSCDDGHWDKKNQCILRGFPNYREINLNLKKLVGDAGERMLRQKLSGKGFDLPSILRSDGLSGDDLDYGPGETFSGLVERYFASHALSVSSVRNYKQFLRHMNKCFDDKISKWNAEIYVKHLRQLRLSDSSIRLYTSLAKALGLDMKNIVPQKFKMKQRDGYVHHRAMVFWRDELLERIRLGLDYSESSEDMAVYYAYFIYMTGLAVVDIARLRNFQVKRIKVGQDEYYIISGNRHKTGVEYRISLKRTDEIGKIMDAMHCVHGLLFLPMLDKKYLDRGDGCDIRINTIAGRANKNLKSVIIKLNGKIARHNRDNGDNIPSIPYNTTLYTFRHSCAMHLYNTDGVSIGMLAQWLGRSPNSISAYIHQLESESDMVNAANTVTF